MVFKLNSPSILQHFAWVPLRLFGKIFCSYEIKGSEHVKNIKGNVILASNHGSELDPLMLVSALPYFSHILPLTFVSRSKDFYQNNPRSFLYGGKFFALMGAVPAYSGLNDYEKSLKHHLDAIYRGQSICIFPVGKKHRLNDFNTARGGVSYLALKTGLPIIPAKIEGLGGYSIMDYLKGKTNIRITFGAPIQAKDIFTTSADKKKLYSHKECEKAAVTLMGIVEKL